MGDIPKPGQIFDAKYKIEEILGSGGYGTVYKARQLDCNRTVALKVLHGEIADEIDRSRFVREAQTLNKLSHANIVTVYHMGVSGADLPYLAMEYIRGKNLRDSMGSRLPVTRSLKLVQEIARTMEYVHQCNVIHRDLKPENILLLQTPSPDTIKLLDFGLVKVIEKENGEGSDQKLTSTGYMMGSITYMSPEQCMGKKVDLKTDIYSLTVILYELICGKLPFEADNPVGMAYKHINETLPKLTAADVDLFHPQLNDLLAKGMAKDPQKRFSSMGDLADEIDTVLELCSIEGVKQNPRKSVLVVVVPVLIAAAGLSILFSARPQEPLAPAIKGNVQTAKIQDYKRKISSFERTYGSNSPELAINLKKIGDDLMADKKVEEAREVYQRALEICGRSIPERDTFTTLLLESLGDTYFTRHQHTAALPYYEKSLKGENKTSNDQWKYHLLEKMAECYLGCNQSNKAFDLYKHHRLVEHTPVNFQMLSNLMEKLYEQGRKAEARNYGLIALAMERNRIDFDKAMVVSRLVGNDTLNNQDELLNEATRNLAGAPPNIESSRLVGIGTFYLVRGNLSKAAPLLERSAKLAEKRLRPGDPDYGEACFQYGQCLAQQEKFSEARNYFQKAVASEQLEAQAGIHGIRFVHYDLLSQTLDRLHEYAAGDDVLVKGIAVMKATRNTSPNELRPMYQRLAHRYFDRADAKGLKEGARLLQQAIDLLKQTDSQNSEQLASDYLDLANYQYCMDKDTKAAVAAGRQALALKQQAAGADDYSLVIYRVSLAEFVSTQDKKECESLLAQTRPLVLKKLESDSKHPDFPVLAPMVSAYLAIGNYREVEFLAEKVRPTGSSGLIQILFDLAKAYELQKRYEEAEKVLLECDAIVKRDLIPNHPAVERVRSALASVYLQDGKTKEAEMLQAQPKK